MKNQGPFSGLRNLPNVTKTILIGFTLALFAALGGIPVAYLLGTRWLILYAPVSLFTVLIVTGLISLFLPKQQNK
jgi:hypothetical protein